MEQLKQAGDQATHRLEDIRKRVGASLGEYSVRPVVIEISGRELQRTAIKFPDQPILDKSGEFYIAYIKDHNFHGLKADHDLDIAKHPHKCFVRGNKIHVYHCSTLRNMESRNRQRRYRLTRKTDSILPIDLQDANDVETRLAWCQNCIKILRKHGKTSMWGRWRGRGNAYIAQHADPEHLIGCVKACHYKYPFAPKAVAGLDSPAAPSGYPLNWREITGTYRQSREFICEICGVDCSDHPGLVDTHHINGVKGDIHDDNFACLCKYHHAKIHAHYRIGASDMNLLRQLWAEQNIDGENLPRPPQQGMFDGYD